MINLIDGNNIFRRRLEVDPTGFALRNMYVEAMTSPHVNIWVWDGYHARKKRRALYDGYKGKREAPADGFFELQQLFKDVLEHSKAIQVQVDGFEADDVIANLALKHRPCHIFSNDADLLQLTVLHGITQEREPMAKCPDPKYIRLYKTLVGDSADNISGIKGFGDKAWSECNKHAIQQWCENPWRMQKESHMARWNVKPAVVNWMLKPENQDLINAFWTIVGFFDVSDAEIDANTIVGVPNEQEAEILMQEYMQ